MMNKTELLAQLAAAESSAGDVVAVMAAMLEERQAFIALANSQAIAIQSQIEVTQKLIRTLDKLTEVIAEHWADDEDPADFWKHDQQDE